MSINTNNPNAGQEEFKYIELAGHQFIYNRENLHFLCDRVEQVTGKMAEIGSLCGFSTKIFARRFEHVISVDPYKPGYDPEDENSDPHRLSVAKSVFEIRFIDEPNVEQIRQPSKVASVSVPNGSLDLVYIDATHQYKNVLQDIHCWAPKLRPGGYMAGHDIDRDGVCQAVNEYFSSGVETIGLSWIVKTGD